MLLGSIEAGGTKFVCAVGNKDYQVQDKVIFPTTTPEETIGKCIDWFDKYRDELTAIGIASFGPIEIRQNDPKYGFITNTPKQGWVDTDFVGPFKKHFDLPIAWTTDVNGSAYGEYVLATLFNQRVHSLIYYTIGTGVGAGEVVDGRFIGGMGHPEVGHIRVKRHPDDLDFAGICHFHGDCLEGLVAGPTFQARLGISGREVPLTNHVWDIMAYYVAQAALDSTLMFRPDKIVLGGGVVSEQFLKKVRREFKKLLNNYVDVGDVEKYITMPLAKGNGSATIGNFALALKELQE